MEMLVNIDVDDLEKAVAFYRDALGLQAERRLFDGSVVEMAGASSKIHLLAKAPYSAASSQAAFFVLTGATGLRCISILQSTMLRAR